ncbi:unnamed protein product [Caenorhabditis bovis]|uniref:Uncharacterized protein n=1 Tax=Caenorhabditis bovis TaxID=2654633 RepID=A0A8S1EBW2_9PELO|nr:unnamed protein product [Caenorhabditis bovis]
MVASNVYNKEHTSKEVETETQVFEIENKKLQQYWQFASTTALIKAQTRKALKFLPKIEQIVFQQCASDAKTVVELSKCAVRVFDAKLSSSIESPPNPSTPQILKIEKIRVSPAEIVMERPSNSSEYYYSSMKQQWIRNPIRRQKIRRRLKRRDEMMEAYEKFLEEQRALKKAEDLNRKRNEVKELTSKVSRNLFGLPRHMKIPERKRREIKDMFSSAHFDFPKLATKYLGQFVGGNNVPHNHLDNIRRFRNHFQRVEKCNGYFKLMNDENKKIFDKLNLGINSRPPILDDQRSAIDEILEIINEFTSSEFAKQNKFSFLSPRILSIMPEGQRKNRLLSPTIFSFHRDGFFSLPDLFEIVSSNQRYQQLMLEAVLDLSGAGSAIEALLEKMEPSMKFMEEVQYPLVQKMSREDIRWLKTRQMFTDEQWREYEDYGVVHLTKEQLEMLYDDESKQFSSVTDLSIEERDERIEADIRKLAALGRPKWPFWDNNKRVKRAGGSGSASVNIPNYPYGEFINGVEFMTLKPYAFANLINFGVSMEAAILSPHAFISEIMRPEALKLDLLSPRAFVATVLSPSALIARILSPTAFRAEVLSPRALTAWVLSPEALVAEVLSPRFLEPRVLSPEAMVIDVLSPGILSPHVASFEALGVIILSPNILSPRIASEEKFIVEVLSPHILGGPHSVEEKEHDVAGGDIAYICPPFLSFLKHSHYKAQDTNVQEQT